MRLLRLVTALLVMAGPLFAAPVKVTISPTTASVGTGATKQFTATVTNTSNTAVTWTIQEGPAGGSVTAGLYTAPANAGTYHVIATSQADATKKATATVTVTAPAGVSVAISPTSATLMPGDWKSFNATVTGGATSGVTWSVTEGTAGGSVNGAGVYTAPANTGTFHVVATSVDDPSKSATATVTVIPASPTLVLNPIIATLTAYTSLSVTASFTHSADTRLAWSLTGGTVSEAQTDAVNANVYYKAPVLKGTYILTATSIADPTKRATTTITVVDPTGPTVYDLKVGAQLITPAVGTSLTPYFYASGAAATIDNGLGTVTSGTNYTVKPPSLAKYMLTLKKSGKVVGSQQSDWIAPQINASATKDTALATATAYSDRGRGKSVVIRPDGKIAVAGGGTITPQCYFANGWGGQADTGNVPYPTEQTFDLATGIVTTQPGVFRAYHAPLVQANGEIAYFGGTLRDSVLYDENIATYGAQVSMSEGFRNRYSGAVALQGLDGKSILIGGRGAYSEYADAEHRSYYLGVRVSAMEWVETLNPASGVRELMKMQSKRDACQAILLRDGRVFVVAGGYSYGASFTNAQPEVIDLVAKTSTVPAAFRGFWDSRAGSAVAEIPTAAMMADGKVLIVEDVIGTGERWLGIWDPVADTYIRKLQTAQWGWVYLADPIGDGMYPMGWITPTASPAGSHMVLYDSVKNAVMVTANLNIRLNTDATLQRIIGLTAQGDVLVENEAVSRINEDQTIYTREPWRIALSLPLVTFPSTTSVPLGRSLQFSAKSLAPQSVAWSVLEGATGGTIAADGTYTAPNTAGIYHVVATAASGRSVSTVHVIPSMPVVNSVTLDRETGPVGCTVNVAWSVTNADSLRLKILDTRGNLIEERTVTGQSSTTVTVPTDLYSFSLQATNAMGSAYGDAVFRIWAVSYVVITPSGTNYMLPGATRTFTATVTGVPGTPSGVTWTRSGGEITQAGVYTAPTALGTYSVTATSDYDPTKSRSAQIVVGLPATISSFTATHSIVAPGQPVNLLWSVTGNPVVTITQRDLSGNLLDSWGVSSPPYLTVTPTETSIFTLEANNPFGGQSAQVQVQVSPVTALAVTPTAASMVTGATRSFGASITSTGSSEVVWSASGGTITSSGLSASYTAPATPGAFTVTVTAVADPTRSATATVTVAYPEVTLSITPETAALPAGEAMALGSSIQVVGSSEGALTWSCSGGRIIAKGPGAVFIAPLVPGTYTATATSVANPTVTATASIEVFASASTTTSLSVVPSSATLSGGQRLLALAAFRASNPGTGVDWTSNLGQLQAEASGASAFFTAPLALGVATLSALSRADASLTAASTVTIQSAPGVYAVAPSEATITTGQSLLLEAYSASGVLLDQATWTVLEPGGGLMAGSGLYFAPQTPGTYHVTATNPANPAESATATIIVVQGSDGGGGGGDGTPTDYGVTVSPPTAQIPAGTYQSLSAVVRGMDDQSVAFVVLGTPSTASVGSDGVFTANLPGTYTVKATSTANPALSGTAVLTVVSSVTPIPGAPVNMTLRGYTVTALQNGKILIAGGFDGTNHRASAQLYDPDTRTFTDTPAMLTPRSYHTAALLNDGRVLMAGGVGEWDAVLGQVRSNNWSEVYNPATGAFESLPSRPLPNGETRTGYMRSSHTTAAWWDGFETDGFGQGVSTVLGNGQVLIAGGPMVTGRWNGGPIEEASWTVQRRISDVFTPGTDHFDVSNWDAGSSSWTTTANSILTRKGTQLVTLDDGRALLTGGMIKAIEGGGPCGVQVNGYGACALKEAKVFDPVAGAFSTLAPMNEARAFHTLTKLADGRVLIVGGYKAITLDPAFSLANPTSHPFSTATAEIYDPATGVFTPTGSLSEARARHAAILLPTGKVMIVGGKKENGDGWFSWPRTIEVFDPETGNFSVMDHLDYGIEEPKVVLQSDGDLFITGVVKGLQTPAATLAARSSSNRLQTLSGSTQLSVDNIMFGTLRTYREQLALPEDAALQNNFKPDLQGPLPRRAVISIPLPPNADVPGASPSLWVGRNERRRNFLIKFTKPTLPWEGDQFKITGIQVTLEAGSGNQLQKKVLLGVDSPQPIQTGIFESISTRDQITYPEGNATQAQLDDIGSRLLKPTTTSTEREIYEEHLRKRWTQSWLPATAPPPSWNNVAYYRVRVSTGVDQLSLSYGLVNGLVVSPPQGNLKYTFRLYFEFKGKMGFTDDVKIPASVAVEPQWSVAQFFQSQFYPSWNNDKWADKKTFDWLSDTNRRAGLEPVNDITLEHGRNTDHAEHRNGNQADVYHPGYGVFINNTGQSSATDFTTTYLVPTFQQAAGWVIRDAAGTVTQTVAPNANARNRLIQWLTQSRSRIEGYMGFDPAGQYAPMSYRYLTSAESVERDNGETYVKMMMSCSLLRDLMLKGKCINLIYTDEATGNTTTYGVIDLTNDIGAWNVNRSTGVIIPDGSATHTNHMHVNWGQKTQAFLNNGTNH